MANRGSLPAPLLRQRPAKDGQHGGILLASYLLFDSYLGFEIEDTAAEAGSEFNLHRVRQQVLVGMAFANRAEDIQVAKTSYEQLVAGTGKVRFVRPQLAAMTVAGVQHRQRSQQPLHISLTGSVNYIHI